jgi:hypothetical protein
MTRREFMALLGGAAAAWPLAARAQQAGKVWRIGFVAGGERAAVSHILAGFPQGMRELGYAEGRDFTIEWRFAEGNVERFSEFAAELVRLRVDAIVVATAAAVRAVQQATNTIPIIMSYSTDPVGNGFVVSLARPGGNTTGLASSTDDTAPKQLELLTTIAPSIRRVGLLEIRIIRTIPLSSNTRKLLPGRASLSSCRQKHAPPKKSRAHLQRCSTIVWKQSWGRRTRFSSRNGCALPSSRCRRGCRRCSCSANSWKRGPS